MISNFPTKKLSNRGGLVNFKFIPAFQVISTPVIIGGSVATPVTLSPGASWLNGYATAETLDYKEEFKGSPNGPIVSRVLSGFMPGDSPELISLMEIMIDMPFCVHFTDPKGKTRIGGTNGFPLIFSASFASGSARSDSRGYQFEFAADGRYSSPGYLG